MRHQQRDDDPTAFAQKLWWELGHTAKVYAALDAWHAINSRDHGRCQYWKEVFTELDRLEDIETTRH